LDDEGNRIDAAQENSEESGCSRLVPSEKLQPKNEKRAERPVFADVLAERGGFEPPIGD